MNSKAGIENIPPLHPAESEVTVAVVARPIPGASEQVNHIEQEEKEFDELNN